MRMDFRIENYYSKSSWDFKEAIDRAQVVLDNFIPEKLPKDISNVLELYNIYLMIVGETNHSQMMEIQKYDNLAKPLMSCVASFFNGINADIYETIYRNTI